MFLYRKENIPLSCGAKPDGIDGDEGDMCEGCDNCDGDSCDGDSCDGDSGDGETGEESEGEDEDDEQSDSGEDESGDDENSYDEIANTNKDTTDTETITTYHTDPAHQGIPAITPSPLPLTPSSPTLTSSPPSPLPLTPSSPTLTPPPLPSLTPPPLGQRSLKVFEVKLVAGLLGLGITLSSDHLKDVVVEKIRMFSPAATQGDLRSVSSVTHLTGHVGQYNVGQYTQI